MKKEFVRYFYHFLNSPNQKVKEEEIAKVVNYKILVEQAFDIVKEVLGKEILKMFYLLWTMARLWVKDGFGVYFFNKVWSVVGNYMVKTIQDFFKSRSLFKKMNCSIIALILM